MACLDFDAVWITVASDPEDALRLQDASALARQPSEAVIYQQTDNRTRALTTGRTTWPWQIDCAMVPTPVMQWLRDHVAVLVCVRDPLGQKVFGMYDTIDESIIVDSPGWYSASLTVNQITHSEAV